MKLQPPTYRSMGAIEICVKEANLKAGTPESMRTAPPPLHPVGFPPEVLVRLVLREAPSSRGRRGTHPPRHVVLNNEVNNKLVDPEIPLLQTRYKPELFPESDEEDTDWGALERNKLSEGIR